MRPARQIFQEDMNLQKLNVKFFMERADGISLTDFIGVFHSWIQTSDGEYYDLADYSHMVAGPGILLIAHDANVSIDQGDHRLGLLYNQKQPLEGTNQEKLRWVFRQALEACRRIEGEPKLQGKFKFRGDEALLLINDRLLAPNTAETFYAIKSDLEALARRLYAGMEFSLDHDTSESRGRFSVSLRTPTRFEISALQKNLGDH
jgi:hypothetical protein